MTRTWERGAPRKLLLATDMSARCDRAFDRAVMLARTWGAQLHILRVMEGSDLIPRAVLERDVVQARAALAREVERTLQGQALDYALEVVLGDADALLLETATRIGCDLIVAGPGRYDRLREVLFGSTVDKMIRRAPCPVLMVNARPHGAYATALVAVDDSEPSRQALDCALSLFPGAQTTVLHACPVSSASFASLVAPTADRTALRQKHEASVAALVDATLRRRAAAGLAGTVAETRVVEGDAASAVYDEAQANHPDLIVVGTHGRTGLLQTALGNTIERITAIVDSDILAVRADG